MASLPKYKRTDLDYNGLPSWLFTSTPANFQEELVKAKANDEKVAELDAAENIRSKLQSDTPPSEEELMSLLAQVRPEMAKEVLSMRDDREDDARRDRALDIQQMQILRDAPGIDPNSEMVPEAFRGLPPEFFQGEQKLQKIGDEIVSVDPRTGAVRPVYRAQGSGSAKAPKLMYNEYGEPRVGRNDEQSLIEAINEGLTQTKPPDFPKPKPQVAEPQAQDEAGLMEMIAKLGSLFDRSSAKKLVPRKAAERGK